MPLALQNLLSVITLPGPWDLKVLFHIIAFPQTHLVHLVETVLHFLFSQHILFYFHYIALSTVCLVLVISVCFSLESEPLEGKDLFYFVLYFPTARAPGAVVV